MYIFFYKTPRYTFKYVNSFVQFTPTHYACYCEIVFAIKTWCPSIKMALDEFRIRTKRTQTVNGFLIRMFYQESALKHIK